jgi:GH25 family lysozyme M1 (1,4-beta-N-acetylmuramidase)
MRTIGVDVSHWEGVIDWSEAVKWVPFAYFKCTDGVSLFDNTYLPNKNGCLAVGMPYAPYHYFEPDVDPETQAATFVAKAGDHHGRYIADFEEPGTGLPDKYRKFLIKVEQLTGGKPAIYTSASHWNERVKPHPAWAHEYELIVAHYTIAHAPTLPIGWDKWLMWQYCEDSYYFSGCSCATDANWFNGTLDQMRQWFGNYRQVGPAPVKPYQVKSLFDGLHIRQIPNCFSKELGHLAKGEIVDVEELGGDGIWIRHARGWSAFEIDGYRYMEVVK